MYFMKKLGFRPNRPTNQLGRARPWAYLTLGATETTRETALISPHWPFCLVRSSTILDALYLPSNFDAIIFDSRAPQ